MQPLRKHALAGITHDVSNTTHNAKVTTMKKTLFSIKNLFEREKSLKDYAWYIWF